MYVVDPAKLTDFRDMLDRDILQMHFELGISRPLCYRKLCADVTGEELVLTRGQSGWWSGLLLDRNGVSSDRDSPLMDFLKSEKEEQRKRAGNLLSHAVFATTPENVATALLLQWADAQADLWYDDREFEQFYFKTGWSSLADAVPFAQVLKKVAECDGAESPSNLLESAAITLLVLNMQCVVLREKLPAEALSKLDSSSDDLSDVRNEVE
jgi:hypothetical protein